MPGQPPRRAREKWAGSGPPNYNLTGCAFHWQPSSDSQIPWRRALARPITSRVSWNNGQWVVQSHDVGSFRDEEATARDDDVAVLPLAGEFAKLHSPRRSRPGYRIRHENPATGAGAARNQTRLIRRKSLSTKRRGRDSNPRYGCPYTAFPVPHLRPLGHLSVVITSCPAITCNSNACQGTL